MNVTPAAVDKNLQPLISVVLLSHDRPEFLREALVSLLQQSHENLEISVVDNLSPASEEVARIVGQYPKVKLIRNSLNLGYTGGMNIGIEQATGDYVLLTEDDIVLEKDCIQQLVEYMGKHSSADLVAPIIYNKTENTIRCAGGDFVLGGVFGMTVYGADEPNTGQFPRPFEVNYLAGATLFARKDFWKLFRGFREEYFMYVDDVELCARVKRAGKRLTVVPQAKVYHFEPRDGKRSREMEFHRFKNHFGLYFLHARLRVLPEFYLRYGVVNLLRAVGSDRKIVWSMIKAWAWFLLKTPSLVRERLTHGNRP